MNRTIGVIPARWASTRFEGKILAQLSGKPIIQHVWEKAVQAEELEDVYIACDIEPVKDVCEGFGAKVVMTKDSHPSGTDRIAEAVGSIDASIVVNIQGDEPLIDPGTINALARALKDKDVPMATAVVRIRNEDDFLNPNIVKAVTDGSGKAMYFSRSPIPYNRDGEEFSARNVFKHLGLYAYRKEFLLKITEMPVSPLERSEKLEQLRVLEAGFDIQVVETKHDALGVDTPEDLERIRSLIGDAA